VTDQKSKRLKPWRQTIKSDILAELSDDWQPVVGPITLQLRFALPKPKSAPKTRRVWPSGRVGDLDKLVRAVMDAMTDAGVWLDDAQVCELFATKDYPGPDVGQMTPGVIIKAYRLVPPIFPPYLPIGSVQ
jgi:crossover junction endodeoxyribonuclease RusA